MVVLGNPPYAGHGANKGFWISDYLLKKGYPLPDGSKRPGYYEVDGEPLGERNPKWLQDDYVKFLRWAQWRIDKEGRGVVGMITNHSYLDSPTFRGMRQNLMATFDALYLFDLHGNAKKKERAPDGSKDENVFDIQQGVAVALFARGAKTKGVKHADLHGLRRGKYAALDAGDITTTEWATVEPGTPWYVFKKTDKAAEDEYRKGFIITEVAPVYGVGMTTARDRCVIEWPDAVEELVRRVEYFRDSEDSNAAVCERLGIPMKKGWNISRARQLAKGVKTPSEFIVPLLYRPFDERVIFYHDSLVWRTVKQIMCHMLAGGNLGLITPRNLELRHTWRNVLVTDSIIEHVPVSLKTIDYLFPLYLYASPKVINTSEEPSRQPNISPGFVEDFLAAVDARALEKSPEVGMRSGSREVLYAEDIFYYIYAILHSPTYRERYAEFLKLDFPRIPIPKDYDSFDRLASAGQRLAELHLLKDKDRWGWRGIEQRGEAKEAIVGKIEYDEKNEEVIFDSKKPREEQYRLGPVPKHVWGFYVGGYQVLRKWLKDRKGRKVAPGDYVAIVIALAETDRIMKEECDPAFKEMMGL